MSEENLDGEAVLNPDAATKKKKIGFALLCVVITVMLGTLGWFKYAKGEPEPEPVNQAIATTTATGGAQARPSSVAKRFDFADEPAPSKEEEEEEEDKPTQKEEATDNEAPSPPSPRISSPVREKIVTLDKSASSSQVSQGSFDTKGNLGIVPTYPTTATQTTEGFNLFAGESDLSRLGSQLTSRKTERALAGVLYNRDYLLAKGAYIDCVLNTSLNSTVAGMTKCTLTRNIYSDNGTTLLLERGSEVTGEYRANLAQGQNRLFVLWDRIKTPNGIVINLDSPATDSLGGGGVDGYVDTHFWQRFGGAMMLSLVDDLAGYLATNGGKNVNNFENSSDTAQNMAAEALRNTINIPPTFYKNQGERVGIVVARDLDFSTVYQLKVNQ